MVKRLSDVPLLTTVPANAEVPLLVPNVLNGRITWANLAAAISGGVNQLRSAPGAPSPAVGIDGDYYIDTTALNLHGPKVAGAWPSGTPMIGTDGTDGNGTVNITATALVNGTFNLVFEMTSGPDITVTTPVLGPVSYDSENTSAVVNTSDAIFINHNTLSENFVPGRYQITVSYMWAYDATNTNFESRVQLDGTNMGQDHQQEAKDNFGGSIAGSGTDQAHPATRVFVEDLSGAHTITLDHQPQTAGVEATIYESRIIATRIGD